MKLSNVAGIADIEVVRDGEFQTLGLLSHQRNNMLVMFYDKNFIKPLLSNDTISCVITSGEFVDRLPGHLAIAVCEDPMSAFYRIHYYLSQHTEFYWDNFPSEIDSSSLISPAAYVAERNVRIGKNVVIEPQAAILEHSILDHDVVIRAGAVIGGSGMEPKYVDGELVNIPHMGGVHLHQGVEIGVNSHVQRSVFGDFTIIGRDTKIAPLVNIAHNVRIGSWCEIAGCTCISGSSIIGDKVWIGPNSTISHELLIGGGAYICLGSTVINDIKPGEKVAGSFACDFNSAMRHHASLRIKRR